MRLKPREAAERIKMMLRQIGHPDLHVTVDEDVVACYSATLSRRGHAVTVNFPFSVVEDGPTDLLFEATLDEALRRLTGTG